MTRADYAKAMDLTAATVRAAMNVQHAICNGGDLAALTQDYIATSAALEAYLWALATPSSIEDWTALACKVGVA